MTLPRAASSAVSLLPQGEAYDWELLEQMLMRTRALRHCPYQKRLPEMKHAPEQIDRGFMVGARWKT